MKTVRIWFTKDNTCKYISHLDLNRVFLRALQKSKLPIWRTEGFNPHPFATFALPLSLGFRGVKEAVDVRFLVEDFNKDEYIDTLNNCLPKDIKVYDITDPVMKPGKVNSAHFDIIYTSDDMNITDLYSSIKELLNKDEIIIEKKSKKGIKEINLKEDIKNYKLGDYDNFVKLRIDLPAGSTYNVNPNLIASAFEKYYGKKIYADITRTDLFDADGNPFK